MKPTKKNEIIKRKREKEIPKTHTRAHIHSLMNRHKNMKIQHFI